MKKRLAYIGLSYPLLYDYKNLADLSKNDLSDSPNPIIESPLGLMILYDELWFLCESICPNNMRNLPYVKFVDKMFNDLYFEGAEHFNNNMVKFNFDSKLDYYTILKKMNIINNTGLDTHTHGLKLGETIISASSNESNFIFDMYIFTALQGLVGDSIEFISNSTYSLRENYSSNKNTQVIERIIIPNIPNYLSADGPYHECMEELRENKYLIDFRRWVVQNHHHIQKNEVGEISELVTRNIAETQKNVLKKCFDKNNGFRFFTSTSKTILSTGLGINHPLISIADAFIGITMNAKEFRNIKNKRWQGFVMDAQDILSSNKLYRNE